MNITDFTGPNGKPEDMLQDIFHRQHELATKYLEIEKANGLLQTPDMPVNIHSHLGQARIKDMFWRCLEEVAEALEAHDADDMTHFYEELGDALHFLVEACILADFYPFLPAHKGDDDLEIIFKLAINFPQTLEVHVAKFVQAAGLACNCLKNKPWKQTQMLTDVKKFKQKMDDAFWSFIALCKCAGFNAEGLYNMYYRKHQVNQFRQGSGY